MRVVGVYEVETNIQRNMVMELITELA